MKKIILTGLGIGIFIAGSFAQITIYTNDFTSATMAYDSGTADGGLLYKSQMNEGQWAAVSSAAVTISDFQSSGNNALTLKGNNDTNNRSSVTYINAATISALTPLNTFELNFDILDINNANGSTLYVSIYEAKFGVGSPNAYYMDVVTPGGTNGLVGKFDASDASFSQLGSTVSYTDADTLVPGSISPLLDQTISFSRSDSSFDVVVFFGFDKDVTFDNWAFVDNVSITAVPEPATYALLGGVLALALVVYRRRR